MLNFDVKFWCREMVRILTFCIQESFKWACVKENANENDFCLWLRKCSCLNGAWGVKNKTILTCMDLYGRCVQIPTTMFRIINFHSYRFFFYSLTHYLYNLNLKIFPLTIQRPLPKIIWKKCCWNILPNSRSSKSLGRERFGRSFEFFGRFVSGIILEKLKKWTLSMVELCASMITLWCPIWSIRKKLKIW